MKLQSIVFVSLFFAVDGVGLFAMDFAALKQQVNALMKNASDAIKAQNIEEAETSLRAIEDILTKVEKKNLNHILEEFERFQLLLRWLKVAELYKNKKEYKKAHKILTEGLSKIDSLITDRSYQNSLRPEFDRELKVFEEEGLLEEGAGEVVQPLDEKKMDALREKAQDGMRNASGLYIHDLFIDAQNKYKEVVNLFNDENLVYGLDILADTYKNIVLTYIGLWSGNKTNVEYLKSFLKDVEEYRPRVEAIIKKFRGKDISGIKIKNYKAEDGLQKLKGELKSIDSFKNLAIDRMRGLWKPIFDSAQANILNKENPEAIKSGIKAVEDFFETASWENGNQVMTGDQKNIFLTALLNLANAYEEKNELTEAKDILRKGMLRAGELGEDKVPFANKLAEIEDKEKKAAEKKESDKPKPVEPPQEPIKPIEPEKPGESKPSDDNTLRDDLNNLLNALNGMLKNLQ